MHTNISYVVGRRRLGVLSLLLSSYAKGYWEICWSTLSGLQLMIRISLLTLAIITYMWARSASICYGYCYQYIIMLMPIVKLLVFEDIYLVKTSMITNNICIAHMKLIHYECSKTTATKTHFFLNPFAIIRCCFLHFAHLWPLRDNLILLCSCASPPFLCLGSWNSEVGVIHHSFMLPQPPIWPTS